MTTIKNVFFKVIKKDLKMSKYAKKGVSMETVFPEFQWHKGDFLPNAQSLYHLRSH